MRIARTWDRGTGETPSRSTGYSVDRAVAVRQYDPGSSGDGTRIGSARLSWSPSREAEACDRDGSETSRIASDQLRSSCRETGVGLLRKEVIQPHLPVRLPCYDFTPIADPTFDGSLLAVGPPASGVTNFRGVTGGVYKARERIHPDVADSGLLATPTSRSRVADFDPN